MVKYEAPRSPKCAGERSAKSHFQAQCALHNENLTDRCPATPESPVRFHYLHRGSAVRGQRCRGEKTGTRCAKSHFQVQRSTPPSILDFRTHHLPPTHTATIRLSTGTQRTGHRRPLASDTWRAWTTVKSCMEEFRDQLSMAYLDNMLRWAKALLAEYMDAAKEEIKRGLRYSDESEAFARLRPQHIKTPWCNSHEIFKLAPIEFVKAICRHTPTEKWMTFGGKEMKISNIVDLHGKGQLRHGLQPELSKSASLKRYFKVNETDIYPDFVSPWLREILNDFKVDQFFIIQPDNSTDLGPHVDYLATAVFYLILSGTKTVRTWPPTPENLRSLVKDRNPVFKGEKTWKVKKGALVYLPPLWIHEVLNTEEGSVAYGVNVRCPAAKMMMEYVGMSNKHELVVKSSLLSNFLSRYGTTPHRFNCATAAHDAYRCHLADALGSA